MVQDAFPSRAFAYRLLGEEDRPDRAHRVDVHRLDDSSESHQYLPDLRQRPVLFRRPSIRPRLDIPALVHILRSSIISSSGVPESYTCRYDNQYAIQQRTVDSLCSVPLLLDVPGADGTYNRRHIRPMHVPRLSGLTRDI